jgi:L-arabinonolactonase
MTIAALPIHILDVKNRLGEGVLWDAREQTVLWTDIEGSAFWRWEMGQSAPIRFSLPERLGCFALTATVGAYVGAFENGFAQFTPSKGSFEMLAPISARGSHLRMNDGRVDRNGTFWAGTMVEHDPPPGGDLGHLWRYNGGPSATPFLSDIRIPNSLCWSRDGRIMYFADSPRNMIWAYDFDTTPVGDPRIFARTPEGIHPDGSCVDSQDHVWNAQWGAGEVVRYRPDGTIERRLPLPISQPSCVAFGGPDLNQLIITSAAVDLSDAQLAAEPLAGALLVYDVDVIGIEESIWLDPSTR